MRNPRSYILTVVAKGQFFVLNLFALYLLLRGHNLPGGGFIAGLVSASSILLLSLALGWEELHGMLRLDPAWLAVTGLALAVGSGVVPWWAGRPFLEHFMVHWRVPLLGDVHVGTPLVFDLGVLLVVSGMTCKVLFVVGKSTEGLRGLVEAELRGYAARVEEPMEAEHPLREDPMEPGSEPSVAHGQRDHATG